MRLILFSVVILSTFAYLTSAAVSDGSATDSGSNWIMAPNTATSGDDPMCQLGDISWLNGVTVDVPINPSVHSYELSVNWNTFIGFTKLTPYPVDRESSIFVEVNGVYIHHKMNSNQLGYGMQSNAITFQTGDNYIKVQVSCNGKATPPCLYTYIFHLYKPESGGSVQGDPAFMGFAGQNYQVHGIANEFYNLISDNDISVTTQFVFLNGGKCPSAVKTLCYSHPGSYLGQIGIVNTNGDRIHLVAGSADQGYSTIKYNDRTLAVGDVITLASGTGSNGANGANGANGGSDYVAVNGTHTVTARIGNYYLTFVNSDQFINEYVKMIDSTRITAHGLLGQSYTIRTDGSAIEGKVDDYLLTDRTLFSTQFKYNKFQLKSK